MFIGAGIDLDGSGTLDRSEIAMLATKMVRFDLLWEMSSLVWFANIQMQTQKLDIPGLTSKTAFALHRAED